MSDDIEPTPDTVEIVYPPPPERILWIMAALGIGGGIAAFVIRSFDSGLGIWIGTGLAFVNYYWLKSSLRKIFSAAQSGERPRILAGKYFLRYIVLAIVVAGIYLTGIVPIVPVILGLAAFSFAVVIEGFIRIFQGAEARTK